MKRIFIDEKEEKRQAILDEQDKCIHGNYQRREGLAYDYGMGIVCGKCGKEMEHMSRKLHKDFWEEGIKLGVHKESLEEYEARQAENNELDNKIRETL